MVAMYDFVGILLIGYVLKFMGLNVYFVGMLLMDYVLKFMGSMCVFCWDFVDGFVMKIGVILLRILCMFRLKLLK